MQIIEKVWLSENTLQIKNLPRVWYRNAASDIISSIHSENVVLNSIINVEAKNAHCLIELENYSPLSCRNGSFTNFCKYLYSSIIL
jgi:hypothetical protein